MKISAFLGSPRKAGNTAQVTGWVLAEAAKAGHETELVQLADKTIGGCSECFACHEVPDRPGCSIKDDMQALYPKMLEADCILIASPVFCWTFSAQMKSVLDRTYCLDKYAQDGSYVSLVDGKLCGLIVTAGGDEFDGADLLVETYRRMVEFHRMKDAGHLVVASIRTKKDLLKPEVEQQARLYAQALVKDV